MFQGTGLGPSMEFYSLVAGELQRKDLAMWVCEDDLSTTSTSIARAVDLGAGGMLMSCIDVLTV